MKIIQIAPEIGPGSGVAGVAFNLEQQWRSLGVQTDRFTLHEAHGDWLPKLGPGLRGKFALLMRVVWFSTVGTVLARRFLSENRNAVSVCHNDVLVGDVYVNHGILQAAMRSRGSYAWRMVRNPLHIFTSVRDTYRYSNRRTHRVVVNLVSTEDLTLRRTYPRLRTPTAVIGNGVDVAAFAPCPIEERTEARRSLALSSDDLALLFVGHEFERKGLRLVLQALTGLPESVHLVVVGGTSDMIARASRSAENHSILHRVHFTGQELDPRRYFHACDIFVLPSAYESYGLVVLEALASGLPVVATRTGCVPDVIDDGVNGYAVAPNPQSIREAVLTLAALPRPELNAAARATAQRHSWASVAQRYLDVITHEFPEKSDRRPTK